MFPPFVFCWAQTVGIPLFFSLNLEICISTRPIPSDEYTSTIVHTFLFFSKKRECVFVGMMCAAWCMGEWLVWEKEEFRGCSGLFLLSVDLPERPK